MPSSPTPPAALPPDWREVVNGIERALNEALAEAADRTRALEAHPAFAEATGAPITDGLQRLDEHLQSFAAGVRQAERQAAEVEVLLQAGQQSVGDWLTTAASFRQKLATWYSHSI